MSSPIEIADSARVKLKTGVHEIKFTKMRDGTPRICHGTLDEKIIPPNKAPLGRMTLTNKTIVRFFDVTLQEWRSCLAHNLISIKTL